MPPRQRVYCFMNPLVLLLAPILLGQICEGVRDHFKDRREKEKMRLRAHLEQEKNARLDKIEERIAALEKKPEKAKKKG